MKTYIFADEKNRNMTFMKRYTLEMMDLVVNNVSL